MGHDDVGGIDRSNKHAVGDTTLQTEDEHGVGERDQVQDQSLVRARELREKEHGQ
jgi:hypothetical protein